jgi:hypothetical protein
MEWVTVVDWPGGVVADFDAAHAERGDPEALIARYVGTYEGDLRIVAVWESKEGAESFFANVPEDIARRLAPRTGGTPVVAAFGADRTWSRVPIG